MILWTLLPFGVYSHICKGMVPKWLSPKMGIPLVCYDNIKEKTLKSGGGNPYELFFFFCEEIMKSSSLFIAEYFFTDLMNETLDSLMKKYHYQTITVHMDADAEIAHRRFHERNRNESGIEGLRPKELSFEAFAEGTKQNKNFRYGEKFIYVNTNDFSEVSYEGIIEDIWQSIGELKDKS